VCIETSPIGGDDRAISLTFDHAALFERVECQPEKILSVTRGRKLSNIWLPPCVRRNRSRT
jgi:hypothetical protein